MSEKKPQPETSRQYGVIYPDGRTFWIVGDGSSTISSSLPGAFSTRALATAAERGTFIDSWRLAVSSCGLDPDTVPKPKFVTREIVRSFGDASEVSDS